MKVLFLPLFLIALGCDSKHQMGSGATAQTILLHFGDPAPTLTVEAWLHGPPVTITPGKVTVIDFWTTWCGPCLKALPHLEQLSRQYAKSGLQVMTLTQADSQGNDRAAVERFLARNGKNHTISFAWCNSPAMYENWVEASGESGFPWSFVIDRNGKVAYIGHPGLLDDVLPKVLDGTWRGKADLAAIEATNARVTEIFTKVQAAGGVARDRLPESTSVADKQTAFAKAATAAAGPALEELEVFQREHPLKGASGPVQAQKMGLLLRLRKYDQAKSLAMPLLETYRIEADYDAADTIRQYWLSKTLNPARKNMEVPVAAAEILLELLTDQHLEAVVAAAEVYAAAGNQTKFAAMDRRARLLTANDPARSQRVDELLKEFQKR